MTANGQVVSGDPRRVSAALVNARTTANLEREAAAVATSEGSSMHDPNIACLADTAGLDMLPALACCCGGIAELMARPSRDNSSTILFLMLSALLQKLGALVKRQGSP